MQSIADPIRKYLESNAGNFPCCFNQTNLGLSNILSKELDILLL